MKFVLPASPNTRLGALDWLLIGDVPEKLKTVNIFFK